MKFKPEKGRMTRPLLLSLIEIGGYPDFSRLYQQLGYDVEILTKMRKALSFIKKNKPSVIVAEFNFQSDFRDRTSSLESLIAVVQRLPNTQVIVFYEKEQAHQLERIKAQFNFAAELTFPIQETALQKALECL